MLQIIYVALPIVFQATVNLNSLNILGFNRDRL